jgi:hypothetical protein
MQELSDYQRKELLLNPNVEKITEKHVVFTSKFKIKAVELYFDGKSPNNIFEDAGIKTHYFKPKYSQLCIKKWKKKYLEQGKESFSIELRGSSKVGRPRKENLDELTYEEMRVVIEIQREVIEELKKRKALVKKKS